MNEKLTAAQTAFTEYFVRNYPGPDTIIFDPKWHAPKIFRAAVAALEAIPYPAVDVGAAVDKLRALHVWPQIVADTHAEILSPRQSKGLYEVGRIAHEVADALTSPQGEETPAAPSQQEDVVAMDEEDRTPVPEGFNAAQWQRADEVHHAMALVADDAECVKILYAVLTATEGSADV